VAGALAGAGQDQQATVLAVQAESTARTITDPDSQASALAQVVRALAKAGQYQRAEATARAITNPNWQAHALAQVAEALARTEDTAFASRVTAAVCVVGRWTTAARPGLTLDPSAFATMERLLASKQPDATSPNLGS
jgi:hypothetical protein